MQQDKETKGHWREEERHTERSRSWRKEQKQRTGYSKKVSGTVTESSTKGLEQSLAQTPTRAPVPPSAESYAIPSRGALGISISSTLPQAILLGS